MQHGLLMAEGMQVKRREQACGGLDNNAGGDWRPPLCSVCGDIYEWLWVVHNMLVVLLQLEESSG